VLCKICATSWGRKSEEMIAVETKIDNLEKLLRRSMKRIEYLERSQCEEQVVKYISKDVYNEIVVKYIKRSL
jgi:UDP-galactopyranose mutase